MSEMSKLPDHSAVENVVIKGDLKELTADQRIAYYNRVCDVLGLNSMTQPFSYLTLNGKLVLYANKSCTEQLRKLHGVSITIVSREYLREEGLYVVTARASIGDRVDESIGAVSIKGKQGDDLANALMKGECVPLDSEILTRDGFKTYDRLTVGEEVLAYSTANDRTEWVPLENITVYPSAKVSRLFTDKRQFEIVCTPDHSWAMKRGEQYRPDNRGGGSRGPRGPYKSRGPERALVKASDINTAHRLILAAPLNDANDSILTPTEAAILGWAVTDGTIQRRGNYVRIGICQSKERYMPEIRALVGNVKELVSKPSTRIFPMSGRTCDTKAQHWWYLPSAASRELLQKAGFSTRADLPRIVTRLCHKARAAMLEAMMMAEADQRKRFANTDQRIMDAFQILCALEGHATGQVHTIKGPCFIQRLKKTRHVAGSFLNLEDAGERPVWCPTTKHGTWVMRQNGWVTITGNTKSKRRATLSICGLAFLDETEVEDIPKSSRGETAPEPRRQSPTQPAPQPAAEREPGDPDPDALIEPVEAKHIAAMHKASSRKWADCLAEIGTTMDAVPKYSALTNRQYEQLVTILTPKG